LPATLANLTQLLSSEGYYVSLAAAKEASAHEGQSNAIDPASGWKVYFIIRKNRPFSISEFQRRARAVALGMELYLATREDLVVAKLEWAKKGEPELQLSDVRAIVRTAGPGFEWEYVDRWVGELVFGDQWDAARPRHFPGSHDPASA